MFIGRWSPGIISPALSPHYDFSWLSPSLLAIEEHGGGCSLVGELRLDRSEDEEPQTIGSGSDLLDRIAADGPCALAEIDAEFALSFVDGRDQSLTLMRDAMGRRPLYFGRAGDAVVYGSKAADVARRLGPVRENESEIAAFLIQRGQGGDASFFHGVERVRPGGWVRFSADGSLVRSSWWNIDYSATPLDDDALSRALDERLRSSVGAIMARHPRRIAHLSAGLDSTLAVATISSLLPAGERLHAYCISAAGAVGQTVDRAISDEYPMAAESAQMLANVDLERIVPDGADWLDISDRFTAAAGMPYRNAVNLGWFAASYAAAQRAGATAIVESTDGNSTYSWLGSGAVASLLRRRQWRSLWRHIQARRRDTGGSGLLTIPHALWSMLPGAIADPLAALYGAPSPARIAFLRPRHRAVRAAIAAIRARGTWSRINRPMRHARDRFTFLLWSDRGPHFPAIEQMFGIELCDPFCNKRLVELTSRIEDERFFADDGFGRRFARELLEGRVPKIVSDGRVDWLQATDWRVQAIAARPRLLADLDFAAADPSLAALFDLDRLREEVEGWSEGSESEVAMTRSAFVIRAIVTIRFVRWARALSPVDMSS